MPENTNQLSGFLLIDKPEGPTSHDIVNHIRKIIRVGLPTADSAKVGHAGTLDPFATGVLLIAIGSATRLLEYAKGFSKTYDVEMTLGATSDTDDKSGTLVPVSTRVPDLSEIEQTLSQFVGPIRQTPPHYAAIKVAGKKLYEYARKGERVERPIRHVTIHSIKLLSYKYPLVRCEVHCSSGTYIRALARDIGEKLGIGSYVSHLRRKVIHKFHIYEATPLDKLSTDSLTALLLPPERLIDHLPAVTINPENVAKFKRGQAIALAEAQPAELAGKPVAVFDELHHVIGIGSLTEGTLLHPQKVL